MIRSIAVALVLLATTAHAAPPTLGADCGADATVVGNKSAGRVTIGPSAGNFTVVTCTVHLPNAFPSVPSCVANNQTANVFPDNPTAIAVGAIATTTTVTFDARGQANPYFYVGDQVNYICQGF